MNKDVIYIEPEDDITDIITKIENSKAKIVALVPPKKAGVFRSVVNIKLISKVGNTSDKTIVLVTTDPSIIKLAAATKIPVTKNLQTPPAVPTADMEIEETIEEEIIEEPKDETSDKKKKDDDKEEEDDNEEDEDDEESKPSKTDKKAAKAEKKKVKKAEKKANEKSNIPVIGWFINHKKTTFFGLIIIIALIVFLVWAFTIAPAATVNVGIKTEANNFAENVTFTTNAAEENIAEGKFYLQEKKLESATEVEFEATGQKNNGEKASGELEISVIFAASGSIPINVGTKFTIDGLSFLADEYASLTWNGDEDHCENEKKIEKGKIRCQISGKVKVTAAEAGTKYNIAPSSSGWSTISGISVVSTKAMSGGTDDIITVVEQGDIEKAKDKLKASNEDNNREKLFNSINGDMLIIEGSFEQDTSAATSTPAAGEEVKSGTRPVLKATTTASVLAIDKVKLEEFIGGKAKFSEGQKVYEIKNPYIENFVSGDTGYAGRLKASYTVGPKITENDIVELVRGKGVVDAQHDLKNINGVVSVSIDTSYPWVSVIPNDTNKITVDIEMKDNNQ